MEKGHTFAQDLSEILERQKVITHDESLALKKAFKDNEADQFDDFLLQEGLVEEGVLLKALSVHYQVPAFDVVGYFFDHNLLTKFPKEFLLSEGIVPLEVDNDILSVVASEPDKEGLESMIRDYVSYDVVLMVGLRRDIGDSVKEFYDESPSEVEGDQDLREERGLEDEAKILEDDTDFVIKEDESLEK